MGKGCSFFANDDWQHNCSTAGAQTGARVTAADTSISPGGNSGVPDCGTCEKGASEAKVSEVVVSNVDPLCARVTPQRTRACASAKHPSTRCVALDGDSSRESRRSEHDSSCVSTETS